MAQPRDRYIPALGHTWLTPYYDVLLRLFLSDDIFKRRLISQANIAEGHRVLDLGCGTATLTILAKKQHPDAELVGLDADPEILVMARRNAARAGVEIALQRALAFELPYAAGSFDRALSSLVIHHLTRVQKQRTFTELFRVLKSGGQLHVADFGRPHTPAMVAVSLALRHFEQVADNIDGLLPAMMREAGFVVVEEAARYGRIL